jgi:hypothetical protein
MLFFVTFLVSLISFIDATYPANIINVYNMKLQIPQESSDGGITTISNSALQTYSSSYFKANSDGTAVLMFAPENGAVTGNGAGPRTELTEPNDYFTFSGTHTMKFTTSVQSTDPKGVICIGQVKGDSYSSVAGSEHTINNSTFVDTNSASNLGASCLIAVELTYTSSSQEVTAHMRDSSCNSKNFHVGYFSMGEAIHMTFTVKDYDVYVSSNKVTLPAYSYSFWKGSNYKMHFKVSSCCCHIYIIS